MLEHGARAARRDARSRAGLTVRLVDFVVTDPADPDAQTCLHAYYEELNERFAAGFDPARSREVALDEVRPPAGIFLVARHESEAVGCAGLKLHGDAPAEIKRMWVSSAVRGRGLGRRLLAELERQAATLGARAVQLDTNGSLVEAIALYRSAGYREVEPFNDEPYATLWFEKDLAV